MIQPYWRSECGRAVVYVGDNVQVMAELPEECFHAIVTDPPYGLEFMGREWDAPWRNEGGFNTSQSEDKTGRGSSKYVGTPSSHNRPNYGNKTRRKVDARERRADELENEGKANYLRHNVEYVYDSNLFQQWFKDRAEQMLRVAKPGAHLLSFGGTRMWHRTACAIEDAGFEIRDTIMWVYGCLSEDTEILTENGWKTYRDVQVGCKVLAWDSTTEELRLEEVEDVTVAPYEGDMVKFCNDNTDQLLTPNHRVYKKHRQRFRSGGTNAAWFDEQWNVSEAGEINRWNHVKLPVAGYHDGKGIGGDTYAELLGWVFTEGGFDQQGTGVRITQSSVNADKVEMIGRCLRNESIVHRIYTRDREYKGRTYTEYTWFISGTDAQRIRRSLPDKHPTWDLLWSMTQSEKVAFYNAAMLGDGSGMTFFQKDNIDREWFQALLHCIGMQGRDNPRKLCVSCHDNKTTELQKRHLKDSHQYYKGDVWCVSVPSRAFVARRNGKVFITGNSGFPKSHDISQSIDKELGAKRVQPISDEYRGKPGGRFGQFGQTEMPEGGGYGYKENWSVMEPVTDCAKQWDGWGTALKPAVEPIVVARKELRGTTARNTMEHGCGGMNLGACEVGESGGTRAVPGSEPNCLNKVYGTGMGGNSTDPNFIGGRWPANFIHDGGIEVMSCLPEGAARYFYSPKADSSDRPHGKNGTLHPTVKPLDLMRYLVRLVCAPGGTVLDPFMGSGSTGCAAIEEGMRFVGIEQSQEYADIAVGRLKLAVENKSVADTPDAPRPPLKRTDGRRPKPKRFDQ